MFDAFTKVVAQADARGEFLNAGQIDALSGVVGDSFKRLDAVNRITSNVLPLLSPDPFHLRFTFLPFLQ